MIKCFENLEDVEFFLLKEIKEKIPKKTDNQALANFFWDKIQFIIYKPFIKFEGFWILQREINNYSRGYSFIITDEEIDKDSLYEYDRELRRVENEVLDLRFLNSFHDEVTKYEEYPKYFIRNLDAKELTRETIAKGVMKLVEIARRKQKEAERIQEAKKQSESNLEEIWISNGETSNTDYSIKENVITCGMTKITCSKNINKIFNFLDISDLMQNSIYYLHGSHFTKLDNALVSNEISYKKMSGDELLWEIKFINKIPYINGTRVRRNKIAFICLRLTAQTTDKEIKTFNNLSQMKIDFLDLKEISHQGNGIPLSVKLVDDKHFSIECFGNTKVLSWDTIRDVFFQGLTLTSSLRRFYLKKFAQIMGIEKGELLVCLRKSQMLRNLQ